MIPYFTIPIFRALVALGILTGMWATRKRARQLGLGDSITPAMLWAVGIGLPFSHVFDVLTYHTSAFMADPAMMFNLRGEWSISSYGGFIGALVAVVLWTKYHDLPLLSYLDSLAVGITVGFMLGRLGCFFVHDHIGRYTDFFLSVSFPGGRRHDLGLDEFILCFLLATWFFILMRQKRPAGTYLVLASLTYGPVRFFLDFFRAEDIPAPDSRYFGLTPAQYCSIAVFFVGLWLARSLFAGRRQLSPAYTAAAAARH
jgi:phosphatidylglycerol:prolipoprotein diacylglycerol transferase